MGERGRIPFPTSRIGGPSSRARLEPSTSQEIDGDLSDEGLDQVTCKLQSKIVELIWHHTSIDEAAGDGTVGLDAASRRKGQLRRVSSRSFRSISAVEISSLPWAGLRDDSAEGMARMLTHAMRLHEWSTWSCCGSAALLDAADGPEVRS